jgi:hypothetical protein
VKVASAALKVPVLLVILRIKECGGEGGILPEHPKKFSVAMVKLKSFVVNQQIVEKPISHRYWRF